MWVEVQIAVLLLHLNAAGGLKCYACMSDQCLRAPQRSDLLSHEDIKLDGSVPYCKTEIGKVLGKRRVYRTVEYSTRVLKGCVEGPLRGTQNPERNYMKKCYCGTDACNIQQFSEPPKVKSEIKCYKCNVQEDSHCDGGLDSKYLRDAPAVSNSPRSINFNFTGMYQSTPDIWPIGPYQYRTYCTSVYHGQSLVSRDYAWAHEDQDLNRKCVGGWDDKVICYCRDNDGCNSDNKGTQLRDGALGLVFVSALGARLNWLRI